MKHYALAASLAVGFALLPEASAQVRASVGVGIGDDEEIRIDGGLAVPASGSLVFLLDGAFTQVDDADYYSIGGHLITRDDRRAWGGFIGIDRTELGPFDEDAWNIGGEYARFLPRYTLAGRVTYTSIDDSDQDVLGVSGEYRLFAEDNLRFDLGAGLALASDA